MVVIFHLLHASCSKRFGLLLGSVVLDRLDHARMSVRPKILIYNGASEGDIRGLSGELMVLLVYMHFRAWTGYLRKLGWHPVYLHSKMHHLEKVRGFALYVGTSLCI